MTEKEEIFNGVKKKFLLFLIAITTLFWVGIVNASSYYYDSIDVEIYVNSDSTFDVIEKQTYSLSGDFGFFYRDIELKDLDHISNVEVFDSDGNKLSNYTKEYNGNRLHIQWDFPRRNYDKELKSWTIKYKVHGGLGFFDDYDELYWNAIFQDRDVNVERAKVSVYLPEGVNKEDIFTRMFVGKLGDKNEYSNYVVDNPVIDNPVIFSGKNVQPREYLTIVVSWPKGFIEKPLLYRNQLINLIILFVAILFPIIVFIKAFRKWWKYGKDPKVRKTVIAHYRPPNGLSPAVLEVLIKQTPEVKGILATVVNLAVRGYIRIVEKENKILFFTTKEYVFEKLKSEVDLRPFEQKIMRSLFKGKNTVSSTELKNKFYKEINDIKKAIYKEVAETDLFNGNIEEIRSKSSRIYFIGLISSVVIFFIFMMIVLLLGLSFYIPQGLILLVGSVVSCVIGLVFSYQMPVLTPQGLESKWKALGFMTYLHTAERFRIGAETLETFSEFLPYAMIFGVEKQWAQRFSNFSYQDQGWYVPVAMSSGSPGSFSNFSSSFSGFANSVSSTFTSTPGGSGAGGAAGGGGGGGGGGAG